MRRVTGIVVVFVVLVVAFLALRHGRNNVPTPAHGASAVNEQSAIRNPKSAIPTAAAPQSAHLADDLNAPSADIHHDLQVVADVLAAYRSNFPHEGNPWGDNEEITAQLTGRNKLHLALIPRDLPAINAAGQLCDRWGTPFFFHAESGTRMAVRSAGPDRKMWTADDVDLEP